MAKVFYSIADLERFEILLKAHNGDEADAARALYEGQKPNTASWQAIGSRINRLLINMRNPEHKLRAISAPKKLDSEKTDEEIAAEQTELKKERLHIAAVLIWADLGISLTTEICFPKMFESFPRDQVEAFIFKFYSSAELLDEVGLLDMLYDKNIELIGPPLLEPYLMPVQQIGAIKRELTMKQMGFAALVALDVPPAKAARLVGYGNTKESTAVMASNLMRHDKVMCMCAHIKAVLASETPIPIYRRTEYWYLN